MNEIPFVLTAGTVVVAVSALVVFLIFRTRLFFKLYTVTVSMALVVGFSGYLLGALDFDMRAFVIVVTAALSLLLLGTYMNSRLVVRPIQKARDATGNVADGVLEAMQYRKSRDEIGDLMDSLDRMVSSLSKKVDIVEQIARGHGDFTVQVHMASDRDRFGAALTRMLSSLNATLGDVNNAAVQIADSSSQLAGASQALSGGASQQASSLEEINSSIAEVAAEAKKNTASAAQAIESTVTVSSRVTEGSQQMSQLLAAIRDIVQSAEHVRKIAKTIDDISFQVNLLALNANVEAARAGKYGKGFAVVADEVRRLAARSADAVKETNQIVDQSITEIQAGSALAEQMAQHLQGISDGVRSAAGSIQDVSNASTRQAEGLDQIESAVQLIEQVTNANTASAEESASAAEELSDQAQRLKDLVGLFRLTAAEAHTKSLIAR